MIVGTLLKQPAEIRRVTLDYAAFLDTGVNVTSCALIPSNDELAAVVSSTFPDTVVTMFVSGGLTGKEYTLTARSDLSDGQRIESEILVVVEEISL